MTRVKPLTFIPGTTLKSSLTQSLSSPVRSSTEVPLMAARAELEARSTSTVSGSLIGGLPSKKAFSGPSTTASKVRSEPFFSRATRFPPSWKASLSGRVVKSMKVPCVPSRSGMHMAPSWAP